MKKRLAFRWWALLILFAGSGLACGLTDGGETPVAVNEATVEIIAETAELPTITIETETPEAALTSAPVAATATLPGEEQTEQPTPTTESLTIETTPAITATLEPVVAPPGMIAPGQQASGSVASSEIQVYSFIGTKFEPVMVFVEGDDALNIAVAAYEGTVSTGTDLSQLTPVAQADFSAAGRPEVMIITPNEDGEHTVVISGSSSTAGNYTLYMYNGTTPAANTRLVSDSLAAGETKNYKALSNGGRPVIVYVDQTGQSDLILQILDDNDELITEANFGGPNSAETAFVLPLEETAYTILISTVGGETAVYNLVIVTLN